MLRSDVLSELYGTRVDVAEVGGRIVVLGATEQSEHCHVQAG